jgi:polyhydroxyalkanoate synthesis regulator phasin
VDDLRTVIQETWSKALLAASSAEEQAQALAGRVGHLLDGSTPQQLISEVAGKLQTQRQELTGHVHQAVKTAMDRLRLPTRTDVEALRSKIAELEARLGAMEGKAGKGGRPSA